MWLYITIAVVLIAAFLYWRWTSVGRGARKRDDLIIAELNPLAVVLEAGGDLDQSDVMRLGASLQNRPMLHELLKHFEKLDLFPEEWRSRDEQARALLSYWMMHPNELQNPPIEIEPVEAIERTIDGKVATFVVLRYRMEEGHWAGSDWLLGLSGPFFASDPPFSGIASAFSRCGDKFGGIDSAELVDWFVQSITGQPVDRSGSK